jgi:hypothetical protein
MSAPQPRHNMANPKHVEILKQGVEAWNRWKIGNGSH